MGKLHVVHIASGEMLRQVSNFGRPRTILVITFVCYLGLSGTWDVGRWRGVGRCEARARLFFLSFVDAAVLAWEEGVMSSFEDGGRWGSEECEYQRACCVV